MLKITIPEKEMYDEKENRFFKTRDCTLQLEHSLVSLSKWESKWNKPFLSKEPKTFEETIDYIKCMTITQNVDDSVYLNLTKENVDEINNYIALPMTATTFSKTNMSRSSEIVTSELIYYWMIALQIPMECQRWHLNRLLTLVQVCNIKNSPPKKMSKRELMSRNASLNAARRSKLHTKG